MDGILSPMLVRQSELKTFGTCAMQYKLSALEDKGDELVGSLTVLGSVFHYAIDVYENYDYDLDLALQTFDHYWEHPDQLGETIDYWHTRTTWEGLRKRGRDMLVRYHEMSPWSKGKLIGTEIQFVVPLGEHSLTGTIDKLWYRPGMKLLEVVDFKTGSAVPEKLQYNLQFTAYCYATTRPEFWASLVGWENGIELFAAYKRGGAWYHARNQKMHSAGTRGEEDYKRLSLAVDQMAKAIERNVFPLDIRGDSCGYCPFSNGVCGSEMPNPTEE